MYIADQQNKSKSNQTKHHVCHILQVPVVAISYSTGRLPVDTEIGIQSLILVILPTKHFSSGGEILLLLCVPASR